jgi:hypothetical protein
MPSFPIPITPSSPTTNRNMSNTNPTTHSLSQDFSSTSPASAMSISPQTPAMQAPLISPSTASGGAGSGSILKWAQSFSKSPSNPNASNGIHSSAPAPPATATAVPANQQIGFDIPPSSTSHSHHDHHDHDEHDSFEFGDISLNEMKARSLGRMSRRAVSMSIAPSGGGMSNGGIAAMLSGFGAKSPPAGSGADGFGNGVGAGTSYGSLGMGSPPPSGVLADKAAKGQGVLRRLSIGGSGFRVSLAPRRHDTAFGGRPARTRTLQPLNIRHHSFLHLFNLRPVRLLHTSTMAAHPLSQLPRPPLTRRSL